jgi:predicted enzyme related to lactoylglutathione lyase
MAKVTGLGGVFFKAEDPVRQYEWYEKHLGIQREVDGSGVVFHWREAGNPEQRGMTIWSIFPHHTQYFGPGKAPFMLNYRVDDLDALLTRLAAEGVEIDPKREDYEYGKFAWVVDPEGNRIELWEPPRESPT